MIKKNRLRFGMIGGGGRALDHSAALKRLGLQRKIICDARQSVATKHAADMGYERAVEDYSEVLTSADVDVVVVVLPHSIAGSVVLEALRAGKHVLTEKPLCHSVELGKQIVAEMEKSGKVCMVSHNYRFDSSVLAVRDALKEGRIGEVFLVQGTLIAMPGYLALRPEYRTRTETNPSSVVLGNGIHGFDLLRFWLGEAVSVSAYYKHVVSQKLGGTGEDTGVCIIDFKNGPVGQFTISDGDVSMAASKWGFEFYGTEGVLRWPDPVILPKHPGCFKAWPPSEPTPEPVSLLADDAPKIPALDQIYLHLGEVIDGNAESRLSPSEALKSLELTLATLESADSRGARVLLSA